MPLNFPLLAAISAFRRKSLAIGARVMVECRCLHRISLTVTLEESYEESYRCVFRYDCHGICQ